MQVILVQEKCIDALKGEALTPATLTQVQKTEMVDKTRSAIILCLRDEVLREVTNETIAVKM